MSKDNRKKVIAGNWKMNKTPEEAKSLITEMAPLVKNAKCDVVACVPFIDLFAAAEAAKNTNIKIGAENCHWAESGAFTGEISANMLSSIGIEYVILGHSERRQYFGETDITVNKRVRAALNENLNVILCVGESKEEREQDVTKQVVTIQTKVALQGVTEEEMKNIIIAYEPVWAIGTGLTATSDQADEACKDIREVVEELYGKETANNLTIQYGGSMNNENADELLSKEHVDGGLIGGASLVADKFAEIIEAASK